MATALALATSSPGALGAIQIVPTETSLTVLALPSGVPSTRFATARAINAGGQIVGWYGSGSGATTGPLGFLSTADATAAFPDSPPPPPPSQRSYSWVQPYDINSSGVIVGQAQTRTAANVDPARYAFGNSDAATPLVGMNESEVTGINSSGQMVGWQTVSASAQAFYYDAGTAYAVPFPQGTVGKSSALGINDQRQLAGYYVNTGGPSTDYRGFIYDWDAGKFNDLGSITVQEPALVTGWRTSYDAVSINNNGQVATTQLTGANRNHAVLFSGGKVNDLGVAAGYEESFAAGIGDDGWVVGYLTDAAEQKTGFLWVDGEWFDFSNAKLTGEYGAILPAGFQRITVVHDAYCCDLNDEHTLWTGTIVGDAIYEDGNTRAFSMRITLQVPEPHTYLMLGFGLLAMGALRLRRQAPR